MNSLPSDTALMLYSPLAERVDTLTWLVWALIIWSTILTVLALYVAFYAKHEVDHATFKFADALQRSLLGSKSPSAAAKASRRQKED